MKGRKDVRERREELCEVGKKCDLDDLGQEGERRIETREGRV